MKPPCLADRLLKFICAPHRLEEVQGDLHEEFVYQVQRIGERRARWRYWWDVIGFMKQFAIKRQRSEYSKNSFLSPVMFRNYFKIAFRNLVNNKVYSFINIGGLAVGMAVAMLIGLWIYDELSFDKYHQNYDRIARVMRTGTINNETFAVTYLPYALGDELKTKYGSQPTGTGQFKHVLMAWPVQDYSLSVGDKKLSQKGEFIEAAASEVFTLNMVKGTRSGLKDPNSIMISASAANAIFGDADPMGKPVKINGTMDAKVTGVYADLPRNTQFQDVDFFAPWDLYVSANGWMKNQGFDNNFLDIYVELQPKTDLGKASFSIKDAILNNLGSNKEYHSFNPQLFLHPMSKWHLQSEWDKQGNYSGGLLQFVWLFGIIGGFVLLLACINFMNLSTARSEKRAKEVGIRKAVGSVRSQLINQFFSESFLVVLLAFLMSLILVTVSLSEFNTLADKQLTMPWFNSYFWVISVSFILLTGLLAGSYPAFYLSSFQPVKVLKGTFRVGRFAAIPRKVLVVIQFTVSVTLIIGTIIVYQQIQYAKDRPIGYTRDGLLMLQMKSPDFAGKYELLRSELKNTGVVAEIAESASPTTGIWSSNGGFDWKGKNPATQTDFGTLTVTPEYGKTVGWQFIAGRDFSREFPTDSSGFVINEAAAKYMGLKNRNGGPPVGEIIRWDRAKGKSFTVLGVIKDMVMESPFTPAVPTVFFLSGYSNWINIKINPNVSTREALPKIEAVFKKLIPSAPFDYKFADQEYALKFAAEERVGKLASVFAILAIFISCLGLFGLASFMAEQRTKEIGVRKVLGATVLNLWGLLSKDFVMLVVISFVLATPIAWYFLNNWLQKYEYHTDISWWIFAASGAVALLITLLTVSFQSIKAALINPVKSLRSE